MMSHKVIKLAKAKSKLVKRGLRFILIIPTTFYPITFDETDIFGKTLAQRNQGPGSLIHKFNNFLRRNKGKTIVFLVS
jgi:hypothetical protein